MQVLVIGIGIGIMVIHFVSLVLTVMELKIISLIVLITTFNNIVVIIMKMLMFYVQVFK